MANWRTRSKCKTLSTTESDSLFFPPPGGKPKKASNFCESCPVINFCLQEALSPGIVGFWAGTTETDRKEMRRFQRHIASLMEFMPKEPSRGRRKFRPVPRTTSVYDPLADIEGPTIVEELNMINEAVVLREAG